MTNKGFNLITMETREQLIRVINESGLPLCVITMMLNEIKGMVDTQLGIQLEQEKRNFHEEIIREQAQNVQSVPLEEIDIIEPSN